MRSQEKPGKRAQRFFPDVVHQDNFQHKSIPGAGAVSHGSRSFFAFQPLIAVRFVPCYNKINCRRMAAQLENSGKEGNTMAVIGIDLGTTNSLACVYRDGKAELIENELGSLMTPSCVSVLEDGTILVGAAAKERLISHPDRTAASFKTWMGKDVLSRRPLLPSA